MTEQQRLVALAESLGVQSPQLDEAVYDLAIEAGLGTLNSLGDEGEQEEFISRREQAASVVNNGGLEAQVEFLLGHSAAEDVEQVIRDAAR